MARLDSTAETAWVESCRECSAADSTGREGARWKTVVSTLVVLAVLAAIILFIAFVVAPSAGAAGGCGGG